MADLVRHSSAILVCYRKHREQRRADIVEELQADTRVPGTSEHAGRSPRNLSASSLQWFPTAAMKLTMSVRA